MENEIYVEKQFTRHGTFVTFRKWSDGDFEIDIEKGRDVMSVLFDPDQAKEILAWLNPPETPCSRVVEGREK